MILGTAAYMAPEQARGKAVDKRADIWAFGVVLYEMLTGRRAFEGEDVSAILAAVIQSEPRWDGVPASVRRLLESCLEKDPKKRLRDIGDVWNLLDNQPGVPTRTQTGILGWAAAGLLALLAAVALWAPWRDTPAPAVQPVLRLEADLGNDVSLVPLASPDLQQRRDLTRWNATGVCGHHLRWAAKAAHATAGSTERHRTGWHRGRHGPVLLPRRAVGGVLDRRRDLQGPGRRRRPCPVG